MITINNLLSINLENAGSILAPNTCRKYLTKLNNLTVENANNQLNPGTCYQYLTKLNNPDAETRLSALLRITEKAPDKLACTFFNIHRSIFAC